MDHSEFMAICRALGHPQRGWQKQACEKAEQLGLSISAPTISLISNNPDKTISPKVANVMRRLAEAVGNGEFSPGYQNPAAQRQAAAAIASFRDPDDDKSDDEIINEIRENFKLLEESVRAVVCGSRRSLLVSGPPAVGKTYTLEKFEEEAKQLGKTYLSCTGSASPPKIYERLFEAKDGGIVIFDDCDRVFETEEGMNLLKGALDCKPPGKPRTISWLKMTRFENEDVPRSFDFQGKVIFMTNLDFDQQLQRNSKIVEHIRALMSRSGYLSLGLGSARRKILHLVQVSMDSNIMENYGIDDPGIKQELLDYIRENQEKWRFLDLRLITHLCEYRKDMPDRWKHHARALLMKPQR